MRTLYLIFSHHHQAQLSRLVSAIRHLSPRAAIAIHHDPSEGPLDVTLFAMTPSVYVVPSAICGEWGDFSLVEQYLHSLEWCVHNIDFDWVITLTGLSYPVSSLDAFEDHLFRSEFDAFLHHFDAFDSTHWPPGLGATRYLFSYIKLPRNPYYYKIPGTIIELYVTA